MKREDDQELWDLLGKVERPAVSPLFARNVLREIRQQPTWGDRLAPWLGLRRLIPTTAFAAAVIAAVISFQLSDSVKPVAENPPEGVAQLDSVDYEIVADLDDLVAMDDDDPLDSDSWAL